MALNMSLGRRPLLAAISTAPLLCSTTAQEKLESHNLSFYVAGVRYNRTLSPPQVGQTVALIANLFKNEPCVEVYAGSPPERLGFAPLDILPELRRLGAEAGTLKTVAMNGVPWKRFLIEIVAT